MIIWSHHYQRTYGRAFRPKNGWEHRKTSYGSFQMSARSGERPAPGALFNYQCITVVKWKELIIKGVRRQRNRGCILAVIMSRMMVMMIWSHHYQHQTGRSLGQKTGGEHREASYDSVAEQHYSIKQYISKSVS